MFQILVFFEINFINNFFLTTNFQMANNSRHYYVSNQNMSDIKESIEEYSINFEKQSISQHHNLGQSISENIQGQSKSYAKNLRNNAKMAQNGKLSQQQKIIQTQPPNQPQHKAQEYSKMHNSSISQQSRNNQSGLKKIDTEHSEEEKGINEEEKAVFLGDQVYETIQERYYETNKISTSDPDVLYNFWYLQKKNFKIKSDKVVQEEIKALEKMMPSMRHKCQIKLKFQRMLMYHPEDVFYSLCLSKSMKLKNKELQSKANILNQQLKKIATKPKKNVNQIVERLYKPYQTNAFIPMSQKHVLEPEEQEKRRREEEKRRRVDFGKRLSEAYQSAKRQSIDGSVESALKLYTFWHEMYDREEYGLEYEEEKAQQDIRLYMIEQVQELKLLFQKKMGYSEDNGYNLMKFLAHKDSLPGIYIPFNSFQAYVQVYNLQEKEKSEKLQKQYEAQQKYLELHKNKKQIDQFGRPISATPLTILAKPKHIDYHTDLYEKYSNQKFLKKLVNQDQLKKARYAFQYGTFDFIDQAKMKQRVRPGVKQQFKIPYEKAIEKMLAKTITNPSFFVAKEIDRIHSILNEDNIQTNDNWNLYAPILIEAMLVKSYDHQWFRQAVLKYTDKTLNKTMKDQTDKVIFHETFRFLHSLSEHERGQELQKLLGILETSEKIAERSEKIKSLQSKDHNLGKEKKLVYEFLQQKAMEFVKMRLKKDSDEKFVLRQHLNKIFTQIYKKYEATVQKHFHYVDTRTQHSKNKQKSKEKSKSLEKKEIAHERLLECPKLFKYEFFKIVKQINPFNFQRDENAKCHLWVPTKNSPQSFNYKTFNFYAEAYEKDRNKIVAKKENQQRSHSLWGRKKGKDREKLMMTYEDAQQCYFQPKISKNDR